MKKTIFTILIGFIVLAVFNVFFFLLTGPERLASMWVSYAFIHIAFIMFAITPFLTKKSSAATVFGVSIAYVSYVYLIVAIITGIVFMFLHFQSVKIPLLVHVALFALYLIALLVVLISNEDTGNKLQRQEFEKVFITDATSSLTMTLRKIEDKDTYKAVEKALDLIRTAPTRSNPAVAGIEQNISSIVHQMDGFANAGNNDALRSAAESIETLMEQRRLGLQNSN